MMITSLETTIGGCVALLAGVFLLVYNPNPTNVAIATGMIGTAYGLLRARDNTVSDEQAKAGITQPPTITKP